MKIVLVAAIRCSLIFLIPSVTYAISAQWDLDPISGDWNTPANWTPNGVPNGPADTATFGLSHTTDVSISADTRVNGIIFTPAATNPYTVTVNPGVTLTVSGTGITNNSGVHFSWGFLLSSNENDTGEMRFTHHASAGNVPIYMLGGFNDGPSIDFFNRSTAANALITGEPSSSVTFHNASTAGNADIDFYTVGYANNIAFLDHSTAGSATLNTGERGSLGFHDHSSAGSATIIDYGNDGGLRDIEFFDSSNAGSATITCYGAEMAFTGLSKGGKAAISLFYSSAHVVWATLDISNHSASGVTIGSLEGQADEEFTTVPSKVLLGANNLTIGSNNLSTTFAGVIQDGGQNGGTGGSLTKIGTGTLILTGANTYTGDTSVNRGVLQVDGSITSNTFVNQPGRLSGTGTINGNLTNNGKIIPGSAGSPGILTVTGNYTQAHYAALMIQLAGANTGDFGILNILGTANLSGRLNPTLLNGFVPAIGDSFTFLTAGSLNGTLSMRNRNIDDLPEHWEVSYFPAFALLTVAAGNVPVPDHASTLLLLMLGLSALLMCRRHYRHPAP